ncbi:AfsR/SARP family transcriptional regulator [Streptomyces orinoci]|uniref:BTAD domain-containing putative transcriptional regulator n=1 Tax=Streptomyces orinoci TaxID=67339 RepID=A0ABV3JQI7_STRON|nr:BTAD domain-containing putative transcriptional regulator [Streptomyces orinoci]
MTPAPGFRFALLGPVRAWYDGTEVDLGRPQQREVLSVLLAAAGRTVSMPLIIDAIWDEGDRPARPEHAVRTHIWRLRRALAPYAGQPPLLTVGDGYTLRVPRPSVDAWDFVRARSRAERIRAAGGAAGEAREVVTEALRLWSAEPLAGLYGPHARALRTQLAGVRQSLLETRLELDAEIGDRPNLAAEAGALVVEYPAGQRLRAVQMLALYRAGRQAEALGVFEDTRRFLGPGTAPGEPLRRLHARILRSDPALRPAAPAVAPRPGSLPPRIGGFTGRTAELTELTRLLTGADAPAVVVSAVNGMAGVGKTALAVHTAHGLAGRFPDGQLYADLRGADRRPLDPQSVLALLLRELGTADEDIPEDGGERVTLYRSLLADRRRLLVLDNAASPEQVRPLIPGTAGSAVLVTSRARLSELAGAHHLRLGVLPAGQALELLRRVAGERRVDAEPEAAAALATACGLLPLALRIAASRLAAEPDCTIAELTRRLTGQRHQAPRHREHGHQERPHPGQRPRLDELRSGDAAVEAAFELSYTRLNPRQARAFRLLSLPEADDLALPCAAALLGDDPADPGPTEELLESLVDLNLLESHHLGRYHFHDLLREFARARSAREDQPAATGAAFARLLDFLLATARTADAIAHSADPAERGLIEAPVASPGLDFADARQAAGWMRRETPVQRAVLVRACTDPALPAAQAVDLVDRLNTVLSGRDHVTAMAELAGKLARVAARRGERDAEALARYVRGNALWHANSYPQAEFELTRALELSTGADGARLRASAHLTLCAGARVQGRFAEAVRHGESSVGLFRSLGAPVAEGTALGELAFNYARLGRLNEARAAAERGAELVGGQESVSQAIGRYYLARVLRECGATAEARAAAESALALFRSLNVTAFEVATGNLLAELHLIEGRFSLAADTAETFLPPARRTSGMLEGGLLRSLGRSLSRLGQPSRARACLEAALDLFDRLQAGSEAEQTRQLLSALA